MLNYFIEKIYDPTREGGFGPGLFFAIFCFRVAIEHLIDVGKDVSDEDVRARADSIDSSDLATLWRGGVKLVSGDFIQETPRVIGQ